MVKRIFNIRNTSNGNVGMGKPISKNLKWVKYKILIKTIYCRKTMAITTTTTKAVTQRTEPNPESTHSPTAAQSTPPPTTATTPSISQKSTPAAASTSTEAHQHRETERKDTTLPKGQTAGAKRKQPSSTEQEGAAAAKRNKPTTSNVPPPIAPAEHPWYESGTSDNIDGQIILWVKAEKVPNQKRIYSKMTDEEKLTTAFNNQRIRNGEIEYIKELTGINIRLMGKNTPMGIPGNGYYDYTNPEHKLAVIKVGTKTKTAMQKQLEEEIKQLTTQQKAPEPTVNPTIVATAVAKEVQESEKERDAVKPLTELTINYKGDHNRLYLYEDIKQLEGEVMQVSKNTIKVKKQPDSYNISFNAHSDNDLWRIITKEKLQIEEMNLIYNTIIQMWAENKGL